MSFNTCAVPTDSVSLLRNDALPFPICDRRDTCSASRLRPAPSPRTDIVELVDGCESELRIVQRRLGTPNEQPEDAYRARELAHKAKNLRFAVQLWEQLMARRNQDPRPAA